MASFFQSYMGEKVTSYQTFSLTSTNQNFNIYTAPADRFAFVYLKDFVTTFFSTGGGTTIEFFLGESSRGTKTLSRSGSLSNPSSGVYVGSLNSPVAGDLPILLFPGETLFVNVKTVNRVDGSIRASVREYSIGNN